MYIYIHIYIYYDYIYNMWNHQPENNTNSKKIVCWGESKPSPWSMLYTVTVMMLILGAAPNPLPFSKGLSEWRDRWQMVTVSKCYGFNLLTVDHIWQRTYQEHSVAFMAIGKLDGKVCESFAVTYWSDCPRASLWQRHCIDQCYHALTHVLEQSLSGRSQNCEDYHPWMGVSTMALSWHP